MPPSQAIVRQRALWVVTWLAVACLLGAATGPLWFAAVAGLGIAWKPVAASVARLLAWATWLPLVLLLPVRVPLENENRQKILAYIEQHPGASIQQVRQHVGIAWGTAVHHLDRLRKERLLVSHRHGNHHRYWLATAPAARLRRGWSVLQQPTARDIAMAVAAKPGMHQSAICDQLDVRAPNASKHLSRLERHGLVAKRRISRFAVYEPTPELQELLHVHGTRTEDASGATIAPAELGPDDAQRVGPAAGRPSGSNGPRPDDAQRR